MKKVTAILIGAGLRGGYVYSQYALDHPDEFQVVAVAEPDKERREIFAAKHHIPEELCFKSYEEILAKEKMADCAMVCTQDQMHYEPVVMAMEKGYHVLCEKPMSPDKEEIIKMGEMAKKYNRILSVCHVLRYSPFFSKLKELLEEGRIGRLITIQHIEEVGYWHHAHSFVRGNWRNSEASSPMILQKCCHDMDIMLWLTGSKCESISSFGELSYFKAENRPKDAPAYCMDGCSHRDECAFYAPRFYLEHPKAVDDGLVYAVTDTADSEQVTASFLMTAFTNECARRIRLMGTKGEIKGDMDAGKIEVIDFVSNTHETIQLHTLAKGHNGSDVSMMRDFVRMIGEGKKGKTDAAVSVESHLMALAAEEARISGQVIDFEEFCKWN